MLVLLALLSRGVQNIVLGPKLPAFISPNIIKLLVDTFHIHPNTTVENDIPALLETLSPP